MTKPSSHFGILNWGSGNERMGNSVVNCGNFFLGYDWHHQNILKRPDKMLFNTIEIGVMGAFLLHFQSPLALPLTE